MWITSEPNAVRAAFVVGKPVGNSVVRSTVARRLRHGFAPLISLTPPGSCVVVRVFEGSHVLSSTEWTEHLRTAITAMSGGSIPAAPPNGDQDGDAS
jgi:ribonuclease P protein component